MIALADIEAAAARLRGWTVRTPLLRADALDDLAGSRLLVKAEPLQRTGSFKFRGAFNAISQSDAPLIVAFSSGNHAQGVALAARLLDRRCVIVMPSDAPELKIANTRWLGAEVVLYDRVTESREEIGHDLARDRGGHVVKPYDDARVMAGQGTVGLEIDEQSAESGLDVEACYCCCGGGGLIAGTATALRARRPDLEVYASEPEGFEDTARSLLSDRRENNDPDARSICDALLAPTPGELTFEVNRRLLRGGLVASDAAVRRAMRLAFLHLKLVIEPGGAVALAAALTDDHPARGKTIAIVASGGNVDPTFFADVLGDR